MYLKFFFTLSITLLLGLLVACASDENVKKMDNAAEKTTITCADFWSVYSPEDSVKIQLLETTIKEGKSISTKNSKFLQVMMEHLKSKKTIDSLPLIFQYPLFPIHRLGKNQIGVLGYSMAVEVNGQWEDLSKEDQLLREDFGYQSIDSMGILVHFPKVYDKLYPLAKPTIYWYSTKKQGKSTLPQMSYMGGECLSYFQYGLDLNEKDTQENIAFGSPYSLDLAFITNEKLDKLFEAQLMKKCLDCPTNYSVQKIFAQLKGSNIFFTAADSWPINDQLDTPSRSMVLLTKEGKLITLWNSELDLFGCGCL